MARSLRTRRTGTVGLVIPSLDNVGFAEVTHGIQRATAEAGKLLLVVEAEALPAEGAADSSIVYERLVGDGLVDGLIVAFATLQDRHLSRLAELGIPLVLVNRRTRGIKGSVVVDDLLGSRMAIEHLVALGHERIAYIGLAAATDTAERRQQGYRGALAESRGPKAWMVEEGAPPTEIGGYEAVTRLLERTAAEPPTAIFVASLMSALGVRAGLVEHGLRIPDDASLIAFNDHPIAAHLAPPLTTVRMPNLKMGQEAVGMLLAAIDGRPVEDLMVTDAPELIVRASTAAPAASGSSAPDGSD